MTSNPMKQYEGKTHYEVGEIVLLAADFYVHLPPYLGKVLKPFDRETLQAYIDKGKEIGETCHYDGCDDIVLWVLGAMVREGYLELIPYRPIQLEDEHRVYYDADVRFSNFGIPSRFSDFPEPGPREVGRSEED